MNRNAEKNCPVYIKQGCDHIDTIFCNYPNCALLNAHKKEMDIDNKNYHFINSIETYESLMNAFEDAGGNPRQLSKNIKKMDVYELLEIMTLNGLRFYKKGNENEINCY